MDVLMGIIQKSLSRNKPDESHGSKRGETAFHTTYSGEKPRYNFELHVSNHIQAHLDIAKAGGDMRERSKARKLLDSLQAKNLEAVIAYVRGNNQLQENFDWQAVSYIWTFIIATNITKTRNVASVQGSNKRVCFEDKNANENKNKKSKKDKGGGKKDSDEEELFYKPKELRALSKEKRDRIIAIREKRVAQTTEATNIVSSVQTSQRHWEDEVMEEWEVNKVQTYYPDEGRSFRVELDNNADTCFFGGDVMVDNDTDRFINVTPFTESLVTVKRVQIISAAIAYDASRSGTVYILIIQALHFPELTRSL
jgi:hypothetical protein